jgi:hypothetical protein
MNSKGTKGSQRFQTHVEDSAPTADFGAEGEASVTLYERKGRP